MPRVVCLAAVVALPACGFGSVGSGRGEGEILFWQIVSQDLSLANCTDDAQWQAAFLRPVLAENTFLVYRLSPDGQTAIVQDCETTLASTCVDDLEAQVFTVDGNTLTHRFAARSSAVSGYACDVQEQEIWTVEDNGAQGSFSARLEVDLVGDTVACDALQQDIQRAAPNGLGIDGCVIEYSAQMQLY